MRDTPTWWAEIMEETTFNLERRSPDEVAAMNGDDRENFFENLDWLTELVAPPVLARSTDDERARLEAAVAAIRGHAARLAGRDEEETP